MAYQPAYLKGLFAPQATTGGTGDRQPSVATTDTLGGSQPKKVEIMETTEPKKGFSLPKFPEINLSEAAKKNLKTAGIIVGVLLAVAAIGFGVQYGVHGGWNHAIRAMNGWLTQGSPMPYWGYFAIGGSFLLGGLAFKFGPKAAAAIYGGLKGITNHLKEMRSAKQKQQVIRQLDENEARISEEKRAQKNEEEAQVKGGGATTDTGGLKQSQKSSTPPKGKGAFDDSEYEKEANTLFGSKPNTMTTPKPNPLAPKSTPKNQDETSSEASNDPLHVSDSEE